MGRVQGVGYRDWFVGRARGLGLAGWVRNRGDGSVEAVVAGAPDVVEAMASQARTGPPVSRVDDVLREEIAGDGPYHGFARRPSV